MPDARKNAAPSQVEPENPAANSAARRIVFISHSNPEDNDFTTWLAARLALADSRPDRQHPFSDIPIQIHNKNVIDFTSGWHDGLVS